MEELILLKKLGEEWKELNKMVEGARKIESHPVLNKEQVIRGSSDVELNRLKANLKSQCSEHRVNIQEKRRSLQREVLSIMSSIGERNIQIDPSTSIISKGYEVHMLERDS